MTAVMVELTHKPGTVVDAPEDIVLVPDVDALTAGTVPGCNDDNPYN
ncbi:hypothetical protein ACIP3A_21420 [Streptomyces tricolor]|uniref:Uncharacterized protein n=1 Tax=Streptomyces tricolor TaxID=68277 RepID=A0ABS9JUM4_9ACTN|nr:hypothetical protein [Streptomyces tricolor]MCG0069245.1 hypothetical protein [Streptomyces tricolor]